MPKKNVDPKTLPKILIVDDSEFSRKAIAKVLDKAELTVVGEAENTKKATDIIATSNPNIMILDIVMPDTNGFEYMEKIAENYKDVQIIAISSLTQEHFIQQAISMGCVDYFQKPIDPDNLVTAIMTIAENLKGD